MGLNKKIIREMTDNLSSHSSSDYDEEVLKTVPYYECFHLETINLVKSLFRHPRAWLDTGCGTGTLIEKALMEFPNCKFYLADPSDEMLQICKKKFTSPQVEIIGKYSTATISKAIRADIITAVQSHHYMKLPGKKKATENCFELLNDNGLYITFENIRPASDTGTENGLKCWGDYQIGQGRNKQDVEKHLSRFDKNYFPIKISEHMDLMGQTGFKVVELFWMSYMQAGFYGIKC